MENYEIVEFRKKFALFTKERKVKDDFNDDNIRCYYIRHSDNDEFAFETVERSNVYVNFAGTLITKYDIEFNDNDVISLSEDNDIEFYDIAIPLEIYLNDNFDENGKDSSIEDLLFDYLNDDPENDVVCVIVDDNDNITYAKFKDGTDQYNEYDENNELIHRIESGDYECWWEYEYTNSSYIVKFRDNTGFWETRIFNKDPVYTIIKNHQLTRKDWIDGTGKHITHIVYLDANREEWYEDEILINSRNGSITYAMINDKYKIIPNEINMEDIYDG